jgi:hypothetical protein
LGVQLFYDKKAGHPYLIKKAGHPYLMIFGKYKNYKVCNEMMQNERPDPNGIYEWHLKTKCGWQYFAELCIQHYARDA